MAGAGILGYGSRRRARKEEIRNAESRSRPLWRDEAEIEESVRASDEALGGPKWIQYFSRHPTELYENIVQSYDTYVMTDRRGLSVKLTEITRHRVAVHDACAL